MKFWGVRTMKHLTLVVFMFLATCVPCPHAGLVTPLFKRAGQLRDPMSQMAMGYSALPAGGSMTEKMSHKSVGRSRATEKTENRGDAMSFKIGTQDYHKGDKLPWHLVHKGRSKAAAKYQEEERDVMSANETKRAKFCANRAIINIWTHKKCMRFMRKQCPVKTSGEGHCAAFFDQLLDGCGLSRYRKKNKHTKAACRWLRSYVKENVPELSEKADQQQGQKPPTPPQEEEEEDDDEGEEAGQEEGAEEELGREQPEDEPEEEARGMPMDWAVKGKLEN